jgi:hypothetical protein
MKRSPLSNGDLRPFGIWLEAIAKQKSLFGASFSTAQK